MNIENKNWKCSKCNGVYYTIIEKFILGDRNNYILECVKCEKRVFRSEPFLRPMTEPGWLGPIKQKG